jgi:hypothetical protein
MRTQKERLFKPNQATPDSSLYKQLNEVDFPSMLQEAMRQEIAARRGDWEIPDVPMIPIVDGRKVTQNDNATSSVDAAIQSLAKAQGKKPLEMPKVETETAPVATPVQTPDKALPEHFTKQGPPPQQQNTTMPGQGIMLDDSVVPVTKPVKKVATDPWAPATDKKIPVGGTVVLGGSKDDK